MAEKTLEERQFEHQVLMDKYYVALAKERLELDKAKFEWKKVLMTEQEPDMNIPPEYFEDEEIVG